MKRWSMDEPATMLHPDVTEWSTSKTEMSSSHHRSLAKLNENEMEVWARIHWIIKELKSDMWKIGRMSKSDLKTFAKTASKDINKLIKMCKPLSHKEYFWKQIKWMDKLKSDLSYVIQDYKSKSRTRSSMRMHNGGKSFYRPKNSKSARQSRTMHWSVSQTSFTESISQIWETSHTWTKPFTRWSNLHYRNRKKDSKRSATMDSMTWMNDEANYTSETSRPKRGRSFTSNGTSMSRHRNRSKDSVRFKIDEIDKKISKIESHLSQKDFATEQAPSTIMEWTIEETIPHRG